MIKIIKYGFAQYSRHFNHQNIGLILVIAEYICTLMLNLPSEKFLTTCRTPSLGEASNLPVTRYTFTKKIIITWSRKLCSTSQ